jgi:hypothetical protein
MSLITFSDIPRSALARLLDAVGEPRSMSPRLLMGEPAEVNPPMLAEMYGGNFINLPESSDVTLTPEFVKVARVLLDPRTNLTIRMWGANNVCGETNIQFPRDIMAGGGVILNQIGRMYRISAFADDSTVTGLLKNTIPQPAEKDLQFEFKAHLDNPLAAALFGIIDLARKKIVNAKRLVTLNEMVFSGQEVYDFMDAAWLMTGFKEMISYIAAIGIMSEPPSSIDTIDGLRVLVKAGFLRDAGNDCFGITNALEPLVRLTAGQPNGLQWQRIALMDNGDQIISNRTFLFGNKSLMLCLAPTVKGRIYIGRIRHKEIMDFLASEIMAALDSEEPQQTAAASTTPSPTTAAQQPPAYAATATTPPAQQAPPASRSAEPPARPVQSVTQSAPPVRPASPPVQQAPVQSSPAQQPVQHPRPAAQLPYPQQTLQTARPDQTHVQPKPPATSFQPAAQTCSNCGVVLKPGAKFCASCGAKCGAGIGAQSGRPAANSCSNCGKPLKPDAKFCVNCGAKS